ncbi:MAG: thioredoxin family protein [Myxococcota bacterium]
MTRDAVEIDSLEALDERIRTEPAVLVWFSGPGCSVCEVLEPKVRALLDQEFPRVRHARVACDRTPEVAAQHGVHGVPTAVVFFDGRETTRLSRAFGLGELRTALERPYRLMFDG